MDETFGQLVRRLREAERWTQERLGEVAGLDQSTISAIERDKGERTVGTVTKLAEAFGAEPLDWLVRAGLVRGAAGGNGERREPPPVRPDRDYSPAEIAEIVAWFEELPGEQYQAEIAAEKAALTREAYIESVLDTHAAWMSNFRLSFNQRRRGMRNGARS